MFDAGPQVILVLGMHRSGTSAVAGVAHMLGATAPAHPIPVAEDNPLGFWESMAVLGVDDWILQQGNAAWYDCLTFNSNRLDEQQRGVALSLIMLSMMSEYTGAPLPLIKDPRLCVMLDLWLPALRALNLVPRALLVLRRPAEVIASLVQRDNLPAEVSAALWLRHMLAAEAATRDCPRHVVSYDGLLDDWRGCMRMAGRRAAIDWPRSSDVHADQVAMALNPLGRHHRATELPRLAALEPLKDWLAEAYAGLRGIEQDGNLASHLQRLDNVRQDFASWCDRSGRFLMADRLVGHPVLTHQRFELPDGWYRIACGFVPTG